MRANMKANIVTGLILCSYSMIDRVCVDVIVGYGDDGSTKRTQQRTAPAGGCVTFLYTVTPNNFPDRIVVCSIRSPTADWFLLAQGKEAAHGQILPIREDCVFCCASKGVRQCGCRIAKEVYSFGHRGYGGNDGDAVDTVVFWSGLVLAMFPPLSLSLFDFGWCLFESLRATAATCSSVIYIIWWMPTPYSLVHKGRNICPVGTGDR